MGARVDGNSKAKMASLSSTDRRRNCRCSSSSSSRRLRHLCALNSNQNLIREGNDHREDLASRVEGNETRRKLLFSTAGLIISTAATAAEESTSPSPPPRPPPPPSASLDSIRSAYDSYSAGYDELDGGTLADLLGFTKLRKKAVSLARGRVLELGVGTGLNLPLYYYFSSDSVDNDSSVTSLTAVDLSTGMLSVAARRIEDLGLGRGVGEGKEEGIGKRGSLRPPVLDAADAAALPFEDSSFDTVLDTFSLCVFPEPLRALKEARRVLEADRGKLVLVEHSRVSRNRALSFYQDATAALIAGPRGGGKGCVWNQDVPGLLQEAGFVVEAEERVAGGTVGLFVCRVS